MPDEQGNETWQDWWNKHAAEKTSKPVAIMKHRSLGKSEGGVEFVSPDTSPDAQEILVVGSILNRDGE